MSGDGATNRRSSLRKLDGTYWSGLLGRADGAAIAESLVETGASLEIVPGSGTLVGSGLITGVAATVRTGSVTAGFLTDLTVMSFWQASADYVHGATINENGDKKIFSH